MKRYHMLLLGALAFAAMAIAGPSDEDLATCEKTQNTSVCLHHLYP